MQKDDIQPNPIQHAMIMGLEIGIWFTINFIVNAQQLRHPELWLLSYLVTFYVGYGIYRAAQHYKQFECGGKISFGQAYSYILWLFLCASVVAALLRFAYMQWIDTGYLSLLYDNVMNLMTQAVEQEGLAADNLALFEDTMQGYLTPIRFSVYCSMFNMMIAGVLGLVLAPMVCRFNPKFRMPFKGRSKN